MANLLAIAHPRAIRHASMAPTILYKSSLFPPIHPMHMSNPPNGVSVPYT